MVPFPLNTHARVFVRSYFVFNALEPIRHTPARTAPIYAHSGERLLSTIEPGQLGIPVLKHLHHVWPHYVPNADGTKTLHLLLHGWSEGKFAVLKHEPLCCAHLLPPSTRAPRASAAP